MATMVRHLPLRAQDLTGKDASLFAQIVAPMGVVSPAFLSHSAFLACSRSFGAVVDALVCCFSMSAAQSAAPTVFVNVKIRDTIGIISNTKAATPNLPAR